MAQSLAQIYIHLVFSTKARHPFLLEQETRSELHAYLAGACNRLGCRALAVGGYTDHVHLLCVLSRSLAIEALVRDVKKASSHWLKKKGGSLTGFQWQAGYGAFSLSPAHVEATKAYIRRQEAHHQRVSFQEELRVLLAKYQLEYDERYLWD